MSQKIKITSKDRKRGYALVKCQMHEHCYLSDGKFHAWGKKVDRIIPLFIRKP